MNTQNNNSLMRLPQVLQLIPISKSTWWEGVKRGKFPKPIKISDRITAWKSQDISELILQLSNTSYNGGSHE